MKERYRRHTVAPNQDSRARLLPGTRGDKSELLVTIGFAFGAILVVIGLFCVRQRPHWQEEQGWSSANATIQNTRTNLVSKIDGMYGGSMFYEVQVLATFSVNGSRQERWITVEQPPKTLASAQFEEAQWKGTRCVVRWNQSDPRQIAVELRQFPELR